MKFIPPYWYKFSIALAQFSVHLQRSVSSELHKELEFNALRHASNKCPMGV